MGFTTFLLAACLSVTVLQLEAPACVKMGESLHMDCGFDLEWKLSLSNVSLITSGYFMCMVTGGDIPFKEDYDTKLVTIAGEEYDTTGR